MNTNREWRWLHNEERNSLYRSANMIRAIKSSRLRRGGHVARMYEGRGALNILTGRRAENRPLKYLGIDGRTILE